jgi:NADPH:quinone reductase-like Zn-dependent oxidoreductase
VKWYHVSRVSGAAPAEHENVSPGEGHRTRPGPPVDSTGRTGYEQTRMRAVRIVRPGGYDRLEVVDLPDVACGEGQVAVDVRAAGVNYADSMVRMGLYKSAKKYVGWPITPGFELAGTVAELGAGVTGFEVGQRVFGLTRFGGYASRVVVPSDQLVATPPSLTDVQAATFPTVHLTAWYALCELGNLRAGQRVLVHSAAGGVGGAALQITRVLGSESVGVVKGTHKVELAQQLGAAHVIDKSETKLWPAVEAVAPEGFDLVLDPNGVETLLASYRHLRPAGRLIIYGFATMFERGRGRPNWFKLLTGYYRTPRFNPLRMTNSNKSVMAFNLSYLFDRKELLVEAMSDLLRWLEAGQLTPLPVKSYALDDVASAQRDLESGTTVGKLALIV